MPGAQRDGDANDQGGVTSGGVASVRVNGRPVSVLGNKVSRHFCCGRKGCPPIHCAASTGGGSGTVKAGGIAIVRTGDADNCGHARTGGSGDVRVG